MNAYTPLHTLVYTSGSSAAAARLCAVLESVFPNSRFVQCANIEETQKTLGETSFDLCILLLDRLVTKQQALLDRLRAMERPVPVAIFIKSKDQERFERLAPELAPDWAVVHHDQATDRMLAAAIRAAIERSVIRWERDHLERAVQSSMLQYRSLFDEVPDVLFLCDRSGSLRDANATAARVFRAPKEKMLQKPVCEVFGFSEEIFHRLIAAASDPKGPIADIEVEFHPPSGASIHGLIHVIPAQRAPGRPVLFQGVVKDITQHKTLENQLRRSEINYKTLYELAQISSSSLQLEDVAQRSLDLIATSCRAIGGLFLMNSRYDELNILAGFNCESAVIEAYHKGKPIQIGRGVIGRWAIAGKIQEIAAEDFARTHPALEKWLGEIGAKQLVGCPMGSSNLTVPAAMLVLAYPLARQGEPDAEMLKGLARTVEMGIHNCHHYANSREAENRYRELWEHAPAFFMSLLKGGVIFEVNQTAARALGYKLQDMIGRRLADFVDEKDRARLAEHHRRVVEEGAEANCELKMMKKDGGHIIASMNSEPLENKEGVVIGEKAVLHDITRDKILEASLREYSENLEKKVNERTFELTSTMNFLNGILEGSTECAIFGLNARGGFVHFSRGAQLLLHQDPEEMVRGAGLDRVVEAESLEEGGLSAFLRQVDERGALQRDVRMRTGEGKELLAHLSINRLNGPAPEDLAYVAIAIDITERKHLEGLLKSYNENLQQEIEAKMRELDQKHIELIQSSKLATLGEMATGVAHELNQPLSGISTRAQLLMKLVEKGRADEGKVIETQRTIVELVERISRIIRHMQIFARQDQQSFAPFHLSQSIEGCLSLLGEQLRLHGIEVSVEAPADLPLAQGEPAQIEQVLLNLVANARYALDLKEARLRERGEEASYRKRLDLRLLLDAHGMIHLRVQDNGIGMDAETRARIFEPFYTTKPVGEGTGLGLSISYGIMAKHNGRIEVESAPGEGTTFHLYFPVSPEAAAQTGESSAPRLVAQAG